MYRDFSCCNVGLSRTEHCRMGGIIADYAPTLSFNIFVVYMCFNLNFIYFLYRNLMWIKNGVAAIHPVNHLQVHTHLSGALVAAQAPPHLLFLNKKSKALVYILVSHQYVSEQRCRKDTIWFIVGFCPYITRLQVIWISFTSESCLQVWCW